MRLDVATPEPVVAGALPSYAEDLLAAWATAARRLAAQQGAAVA